MESIAEIQTLVMGTFFLWAGIWKVCVPRAGDIAVRSALALVFRRKRTVRGVYRLVGAAELAVGLLLLLPPHRRWEMGSASGLAVAFVAYVLFSLRAAPGQPCGCLGGYEAPASWRTLTRAVLLVMLTILGWSAERFWFTAVAAGPWLLSLVAIEALLLVSLSPELNWFRINLRAASHQQLRSQHELDCARATLPMSETLEQLRQSEPFQSLARFLRSDLVENWRAGCWRFLCFEAEYERRQATAVFAVPILRQSHRVRAAIVDNAEDRVLLSLGPPFIDSKSGRPVTEATPASG